MYGVKVASTPQRSSRSKFQELRHVKKRSSIATVFPPLQRHSSERESIWQCLDTITNHKIIMALLLPDNTALQKKILNTQLTRMIIFYVSFTLQSETDISFSPTRLDLAVQEVQNFAFLLKIEKQSLSKSEMSLYFGCFSMYLWTRNSKETSEWAYYVFFDVLEVFNSTQKFLWSKQKLAKIKKPNILSENKWF